MMPSQAHQARPSGTARRTTRARPRPATDPTNSQRDEAAPPDPEASPKVARAESQEWRARRERLDRAREESSDLADHRFNEPLATDWPQFLVGTAEHILDALSDLARDEEFWREMKIAERDLGDVAPAQRATVAEILDSDLQGLLDLMGYAPPPPSLEIATELQLAFHEASADRDRLRRAERSRQAQYRTALYVHHLRPLVEAAKAADAGSDEGRQVGRRLLAAARTGARALVPAAVAAGVVGVAFPPAGVAGAGAAVVYGASAAVQEMTKQGIELAGVGMLARVLGDQETQADPTEVLAATTESLIVAVTEVLAVMEVLDRDRPHQVDDFFRAYAIEATRWYHQHERAWWAVADRATGSPASRAAAQAVGQGLDAFRDWLDNATTYAGLQEVHDRLEVALEQLVRLTRRPDPGARHDPPVVI